MKKDVFIDYLREQSDFLLDLADDIEGGNLYNSLRIFHIDLDKLNGYLDGNFELTN